MATYYVADSGGSDAGPGSSGSPWKTLGKAKTASAPGDTIIVRNGTYYEALQIQKANQTWRADTGHTPVVDGRYHIGLMSGGNTITHSSIMPRIDASPSYLPGVGGKAGLIDLDVAGVTVDGFVVQNSTRSGISLGASNCTVQNCVTYFTYSSGILSNPGDNVSGITIKNNIVRLASIKTFDPARSTGYAGAGESQQVDGSIKVGNNTGNTIISGNDVAYGFGEGINIGKFNPATAASPILVYNNIVHDCAHSSFYANGSRYVYFYGNVAYCTNVPLHLGTDDDAPTGYRLKDETVKVNAYSRNIFFFNNISINAGTGIMVGEKYTAATGIYVGYNTFIGGEQALVKNKETVFILRKKEGGSTTQQGIVENNLVIDHPKQNIGVLKTDCEIGTGGLTFRNNLWYRQPITAGRDGGDPEPDGGWTTGATLDPKIVRMVRTLVTTGYPTKANTTYASTNISDNLDINDARLTAASPARAAASSGNGASGVVPPAGTNKDYFGVARDGQPADRDIGAIEFGGVTPNTVTADFTATPRTGNAPLEVAFTAAATTTGSATITGYTWTFGDGDTSTETNPTHTYTAGTYNVSLEVTATGGLDDTLTRNSYITAGGTGTAAVTAQFAGAPLSGAIPLSVNFTDLSSANGGATVNKWTWNFGDMTGATTQNPTATYTEAGTYTVTLTAEDTALGLSDGETKTDYIVAGATDAVEADFTQSSTGGVAPLTVTLTPTASVTGAAVIDRYIWDFGTTIAGPVIIEKTTAVPVSHTYTNPGQRTPTLTVQDTTRGLSDVKVGSQITILGDPGAGGGGFDVVRAALRTTAGNQTLSFNLGGSVPALVLLFVTKAATIGAASAGAMLSYGMAAGSGQWAAALASTDGVATTESYNYRTSNACIVDLTGGVVVGQAKLGSLGINQVVLDVTTGFPANRYVHAVAIGGSGAVGTAAPFILGANGSTTTLTPGFPPDVYLFGGAPAGAADSVDDHGDMVFGLADGTEQYGFNWRDRNAQADGAPKAGFSSDGRVIRNTYNTGDAGFSDYGAGKITVSKANINRTFHYGALNLPSGMSAVVKRFATPTTTGNVSYDLDIDTTGLVMLVSLLDTLDADKVTAVADGFAIVTVDEGATYCMSVASEVGAATSNTQSRVDDSIVVTNGAGVVKLAGTVTLDNDGFDINWTTVQASPLYFMVVGFSGASAAVGPVAAFEADVTTTEDGIVTFTDLSNENGAAITAWAWVFGDGQTSTDENPTHTYADAGVYSVTLTVTNANGESSLTRTDYITVAGIEVEWLAAQYEPLPITRHTRGQLYGDDSTDPNYGYMAIGIDLDALEMDAQPDDDIEVSDTSKALIRLDMANKQIVIDWPDGTTSTFTED
jgi:PKD repeat protein